MRDAADENEFDREILINSKESRQISNAIRKLIKTGKPITVKLSIETQDRIKKLKK